MGLPVFVFGSLLHAPVRDTVLGAAAVSRPAQMPGAQARARDCLEEPVAVADENGAVPGMLLDGLAPDQRARLDYYLRVQGLARQVDRVATAGGLLEAEYYTGAADAGGQSRIFDAWPTWCRAVAEQAAVEIMRAFGQEPVASVRARLPMIRARAASRVRGAAADAPASLRADWGRGMVRERSHRQPWAGFFTVEESILSYRRFDGSMSAEVSRAGFVGGDAALVLPYDPAQDRVLVIEQFRYGPWLRLDPRPWLLEPIAGRVDAEETPEACARREAREEAGLEIGGLEHVADYYPSPGVDSEFFYTFVGLADLASHREGIGGLASEHEDIRSHVIPFARLMEL
ncbi:MAG TPA: NUDIX domain-containing protein, partial [Aliiroseovarius sp.]|nr:NUDIX domain-containing protein [Aliiroseovarius sp.]